MRLSQFIKYSLLLVPSLAWSQAQQTLPLLSSPMPEGYEARAKFMNSTGNPRGVIDQLRTKIALDANSSTSGAAHDELNALMLAQAYFEIGDEQCLNVARNLIDNNPASEYAPQAYLVIGDWHFFNHDFGQALAAYSEFNLSSLSGDQRHEYEFRYALSLLKTGHYDEALPIFRRLHTDHKYADAAIFYKAYIDYVKGNKDAAYLGFEQTKNIEAGYYLAQMDYERHEFEKAAYRAQNLLVGDCQEEMKPEMLRIAGESLFRLGDRQKAEIYLEKYISYPGITPIDNAIYTLAVIRYENRNYDGASELFSRVADLRSDVGQSANLYLGQCAALLGQSDVAAMAFKKAYQMNFDSNIGAAALYNYIASTTRGGKVPFASSIPLLNEFLDTYPSSEYAPEIRGYLATAYYNEKDYPRALQAVNSIEHPDAKVLAAKQKILYELGMQTLSNNQPEQAETYLKEAATLSRFDSKLAAQVQLWLADALYEQKKYAEAENAYSAYMRSERNGQNSALSSYNYAYSLYQQDKFSQALTAFDNVLRLKNLPEALKADALIRKADCLYYTGSLQSASELYAKAMADGSSDADYAALRRAMIAGVNGSNKDKADQLASMIKKYPQSKWISTALLEQAIAFTEMGDNKKAIACFDQLVSKYPRTPQTRNALLYMAEINREEGNTDAAIERYRTVISTWPTSEQAQVANDNLRVLYAERDLLAEYADWLKGIAGAPQIDAGDVEKLSFQAAVDEYNQDSGTAARLEKYVQTYPDGKYVGQALRYIAEYEYEENNNAEKALQTLDRLLSSRPDATQVPGALLYKAQILEDVHPGDKEIISTYRMLESVGGTEYAAEAWAGIMRNTTSPSERIDYARRLAATGGVDADSLEEAHFYEASGLMQSGNTDKAQTMLAQLADNPMSLFGARATVALADSYLAAKQWQKAASLMEKFTESGTPHNYWLARGYINLADAYKAMGKKSLATEYLRSLRDNYPGGEADIRQMIEDRLK